METRRFESCHGGITITLIHHTQMIEEEKIKALEKTAEAIIATLGEGKPGDMIEQVVNAATGVTYAIIEKAGAPNPHDVLAKIFAHHAQLLKEKALNHQEPCTRK